MGDAVHTSATNRVLSVKALVGRLFHVQGALPGDQAVYELSSDQGPELLVNQRGFEPTSQLSMGVARLLDLEPATEYRLTAILPNGARLTLFEGVKGAELASEKAAAKLLPAAASALLGIPDDDDPPFAGSEPAP